jgi:hypothetical protein
LLEILRVHWKPGGASSLDALTLQGSLDFGAELQHADQLDPQALGVTAWLQQQKGQVRLEGSIERLDSAEVIRALRGSFVLGGEWDTGGWRVHLGRTELVGGIATKTLGLPVNSWSWLGYGDSVPLRVALPDGMQLSLAEADHWQVELDNGNVILGTGDSRLQLRELDVSGWIASGPMNFDRLSLESRLDVRLQHRALPPLAVSLDHTGKITEGRYTLTLRDVAESMEAHIAGDANLQSGTGHGELAVTVMDLPYAAATVQPLLAGFGVFDADFEINSGRVDLKSQFTSQGYTLDGLEQTADLSVQGVSGRYGEYEFANLGLSAEWSGAETWQTTQPVTFSLGSLDLGFELSNIEAAATVPPVKLAGPPVVRLESFSSQVFGGRLYLSEPAQWNFGADSNRLTLEAQDWELAQLVTLQSGQQIEAGGRMQGRLPVEFSGGRMLIEQGEMRAVAPGGTIRYVADEASQALAGSSDELALALDLLEDFRFDVLSADVRLDREGQLWLGLSLAGNNPAQFDGREVNFNVNLEQNIDPLLQSLRLSDKLVEKLEQGLK